MQLIPSYKRIKLICDLISSVSAFHCELELFKQDDENREFIYFPTIHEYKKNSDFDCCVLLRFLTDLDEEFEDYAEIGKLSQF